MALISSTEISGAFSSLDVALKSRWDFYIDLRQRVSGFKPMTPEEYEQDCIRSVAETRRIDPSFSDELAEKRLSVLLKRYLPPHAQRFFALRDPVMSEYIIVALLSHALCESQINALLATGLAEKGLSELFSTFERADFMEKWLNGPKVIEATYQLKKDAALYETLKRLNGQRNALVHPKISLSVNGAQVHPGTRTANTTINSDLDWIHRYFSLPYDLALHIETCIPSNFITHVFAHEKITPAPMHAAA